MGHYAKVNNGIVEEVIVADSAFFENFVDSTPGDWIKTSYNTHGGKHYGAEGKVDCGTPFRKNYASIGDTYDVVRDAFYSPQPDESWTLNEDTCEWEESKEELSLRDKAALLLSKAFD